MTTTILTWANSGNGVRTTTGSQAAVDLINNLATLITSKSGNAAFSWQVAGKVVTGTTFYLLLSRKDASAGRIAIIYYTTAPAGYNPTIMDTTPTGDLFYIAFFPSGTGTTLSNLAGSGTICGVDTNAVKVSSSYDQSDVYATNHVPYYLDSYDGMHFAFGDPSTGTPVGQVYGLGAGALWEDTLTSTAVNGTWGTYYNALNNGIGATNNPFGGWSSTATPAGAAGFGCRLNYPNAAVSKQFFAAFSSAGWSALLATDPTAVLSDPTNNKYDYMPFFFLSQTRLEGPVIKFRQFGFGDGESYPFATRYTTGPVIQAQMFCNLNAGGVGFPWATQFKI